MRQNKDLDFTFELPARCMPWASWIYLMYAQEKVDSMTIAITNILNQRLSNAKQQNLWIGDKPCFYDHDS